MDLRGFVTPEQSWGGLTDVSRNLRIDEQRKEQDRLRKEAGKAASTAALEGYLNPKDFLSGTPGDAYVVQSLNDIASVGYDLISKGVDDVQLRMALQGRVAKLSKESQALKQIKAQKEAAVAAMKDNPAIDKEKFEAEYQNLFFKTDESGNKVLKDISAEIDPTKNYADEILNTKPVYTAGAVDNFFKEAVKQSVTEDVVMTDSKGGKRRTKLNVQIPTFMQLNIDPKTNELDNDQPFIPKYDIAKEGEKELVAEFLDKEGQTVEAELRLMKEGAFKQMMKVAGIRAYFMQDAREFAKSLGVPITDPKVDVYTRALAYDYAKNSHLAKGTYSELQDVKAAPAAKNTFNINTGGGDKDQPYVKAYQTLWKALQNYRPGEYMPLKDVPTILHKEFIGLARQNSKVPLAVAGQDVFIRQEDGQAKLYYRLGNKYELVGTLDEVFVDTEANPKTQRTRDAIITGSGGQPADKQPKFTGVPANLF